MLRLYAVRVEGFGDCDPAYGCSPAAAKAEVWRRGVFSDMSFRDFLTHLKPKVRLAEAPKQDGYSYVRRAYGLDVKVGQRVLINDEPHLRDAPGIVLYPGRSTAHVSVLLDDGEWLTHVHPASVTPSTEQVPPRAEGGQG